MKRAALLVLATLPALLLAVPATADRPATLTGHYYLQGVMETGSELLLNPDGTFQWYLSYGALDLFAEGTWDRADGKVTLTASKDEKAPPPGFDTLVLSQKDAALVPPDGRGAYRKDGEAPEPPQDAPDTIVNSTAAN